VLMNLSAVIGFSDYINKHWYVTLESSCSVPQVSTTGTGHMD
jgi:hypothetical protein